MGAEDIRRQQPNVQRMELLGARVVPVEAGARTLKEAVSEAIRDWVTNVATTHYVIGSAVGPAPYPGDRARPAARDRRRGAGAAARARGPPARPRRRLRRRRLQRDRHLRGVRRRRRRRAGRRRGRRARAWRPGHHGAPLTVGGRPGVLHGSLRAIMQDEDGQITRGALGLGRARLPGRRAPSTPPARHGPGRYLAVDDAEALDAFLRVTRLEGIIPALETAHALHFVLQPARDARSTWSACRAAATRTWPRCSRALAAGVSATAVGAGSSGSPPPSPRAGGRARAHALPDGRLPDLEASRAIGEAYADGGADLVELGVPVLRPAGRRPGHPGRRHRARCARARRSTASSTSRGALARAGPGRAHVLRQPRPRARRRRRSPRALADAGAERPDRARPAAGGGARRPRGLRRRRASRSSRSSRRPRPTSAWRAIGARARGFLYTVSVTGTTGERAALAEASPRSSRAPRRATDVPVALGFGIGTPEQAAQAADAGADGVIVGSRLVRAAAEADGPGRGRPRARGGLRARAPVANPPAAWDSPRHHRRPRHLDRPVGARDARPSTRS